MIFQKKIKDDSIVLNLQLEIPLLERRSYEARKKKATSESGLSLLC